MDLLKRLQNPIIKCFNHLVTLTFPDQETTWIRITAFRLPFFAYIFTVPFFLALTTPRFDIVAIFRFDDFHVTL